jgi:hypothetical protein
MREVRAKKHGEAYSGNGFRSEQHDRPDEGACPIPFASVNRSWLW